MCGSDIFVHIVNHFIYIEHDFEGEKHSYTANWNQWDIESLNIE